MIIPSTVKILIVTDFGHSTEDKAMVTLKEAIEANWRFSVKIVDLRLMVRDEHSGQALKDSEEIELASRKLEALAADDTLKWDDLTEDVGGEPDLLVVFGKSVMFAGGVKEKPILFIDPAYDSEWPWKKQYYADRDAASEYRARYSEEMNEPDDTLVLSVGAEVCRRPKPTLRYGVFTDGKDSYFSEYSSRYGNLAMIDEELNGNIEKRARAICDFAEGDMEIPLLEIYDMVQVGCWNKDGASICTFENPVILDQVTILGLERGVPMTNGQSGIRLRTAENTYTLPLESFPYPRALTALRDALTKEFKKLPQRKRILIVPDYFTPYNAPNVIELRDRLRLNGYYVAVYVHGQTLEKSRTGIERSCKVNPFDLIVALETGCMLTARIINAPRILVNPDWGAWEWMKLMLGEDQEQCRMRGFDNHGPFWSYYLNAVEIAEARKISERSYIRRGKHCVCGWFSIDAIEDSHLTEEDKKRFNRCDCIPGLRLDTEGGIAILANEIDKIINDEN